MKNSQDKTITSLASPVRLFISLLLIIFGIETFIMFVLLPLLFGSAEGMIASLADATLLTLLAAPFLWLLFIRPLRNVALKETAWTKTILEHVVDGVVILDKAGVVDSLNPAAAAIFGYTLAEVQGREMKNLFPEENDFSASGGGNHADSHETVGRRKDGSPFPLDLSISRVGAGDQCMFICIMRDMTGRKQAEENIRTLNEELAGKVEQLVAAQEELMRSEKLAMLGQIAAAMANELRNPLGVMSNAVFFLKSIHADADRIVGEYLEIIKDEIDSSQRIVSDLLDFSGPNSPQADLIVFDQFIAKWLNQCAIPENIRLGIDLPETTPIMIQVDAQQLEEALRNLVVNAIQAMPDGGSLRIKARLVGTIHQSLPQNSKEETGNFLAIFITDSGTGIAPENMPKLFQPLFTTKARGIGLGLAISQKRIEANGGRIGVESALGKGTTFVVTLPVLSVSHAKSEAP